MNLFQLKNDLENEGILISFSGKICQEVVTGVAEAIERELDAMEVKPAISQKVFGVLTEQMQNIMSYSKECVAISNNRRHGFGLSVVGYDEVRKKYFVASANFMKPEDEDKVVKKLETIRPMGQEELREYYRQLRKDGRDKHSRGAGLGFLEMARKATEPLEYNITDHDSDNKFFEIKVYI